MTAFTLPGRMGYGILAVAPHLAYGVRTNRRQAN
jgi:hypothetical protein